MKRVILWVYRVKYQRWCITHCSIFTPCPWLIGAFRCVKVSEGTLYWESQYSIYDKYGRGDNIFPPLFLHLLFIHLFLLSYSFFFLLQFFSFLGVSAEVWTLCGPFLLVTLPYFTTLFHYFAVYIPIKFCWSLLLLL